MRAFETAFLSSLLFALLIVVLPLAQAAEPPASGEPSKFAVRGRVAIRPLDLTFEERTVSLPAEHRAARLMLSMDSDGDQVDEAVLFDETARKVVLSRVAGAQLETRLLGDWQYQFWEPFGAGDLDGDGREELITVLAEEWIALSINSDLSLKRHALQLHPRPGVSKEVSVGDLNCDGAADLVLRSPGWGLHLFRAAAAFQYVELSSHPDLGPSFAGAVRRPDCELLLIHVKGTLTRFSVIDPIERTWAHLITDSVPNRAFTGDFNGDGLTDLLINTPRSVTFWWAAFSNTRTGLEQAVAGPAVKDVTAVAAVTGDFNGDGSSDLLVAADPQGAYKLYLAEQGPPLAGAKVSIEGVGSVVTDGGGFYELSEVPAGVHTISAHAEQRAFALSSRQLRVHRDTSNVHFLALHPEVDRPRTGQIEAYGPRPPGPYVCISYVPGAEHGKWGRPILCPEDYAAVGTGEADRIWTAPRNVPADITCCPLPSKDILSDEHTWVEDACPPGSIVTGSNLWESTRCETCPYMIRCTKINAARYQLGERTQSRYWGIGQSAAYPFSKTVPLDIPPAVRVGLARNSALGLDHDGCVGNPAGALLVEKGSTICSGFWFRELQYRGAEGDPPAGTAVEMFPQCRAVGDIFTPMAWCRR